jgi:uncharacterized membrane protein YesL
MEDNFEQDSGIINLLIDFADLIIANLLWLITSLPVITLGASTAALYSVVRTPGEKRYSASVFKNFFLAFGKNFKTATLAFLILLIPGALVAVNAFLLVFGLLEASTVSYVICGLSILLFLFAWNYVFPLIATFENTLFRTLSNALILSVAHLPTTVAVTVLNLIPVLVLLFFTNFFFKTIIIWLFVACALIAKANCLLLERVFRRYMDTESPRT